MKKVPITPDQALMRANSDGEIGYASGGANTDWPAMQSLLDDGLIRFKIDRSYKDIATGEFKSREIYELTADGRARLKDLKEAGYRIAPAE